MPNRCPGLQIDGQDVDEDALFALVWDVAAASECAAAEDAPAKRRRMHGKQGETTAIEVYKPKPSAGKRSPPAAPTAPPRQRRAPLVRGHYDCLGVLRGATASELRAAYRQKALATHPDKGGDLRQFLEVTAAFEELSDKARRAAYDRSLDFFGCSDGLARSTRGSAKMSALGMQAPADPLLFRGESRVAQEKLLLQQESAWPKHLGKLCAGLLEALCDLLLSEKCRGQAARRPERASIAERSTQNKQQLSSLGGSKCIHRQKNGYVVQVSWASLTVCTTPTHALADAIDWQIAIMSAQTAAQARLSKTRGGEAVADPLTEKELLSLLAAAPTVQLSFKTSFSAGRRGGLVHAPVVSSLRLAMDIRRRFAAALRGPGAEKRLETERGRATREAAEDRRQLRQRKSLLIQAVLAEVGRRSVRRAQTMGIEDRPREDAPLAGTAAPAGRKRRLSSSALVATPSKVSATKGARAPGKRSAVAATPPKVSATKSSHAPTKRKSSVEAEATPPKRSRTEKTGGGSQQARGKAAAKGGSDSSSKPLARWLVPA